MSVIEKRVLVVMALAAVLVISIYSLPKVYFKKVLLAEDIPKEIYKDIKDMESNGELEQGVWFYVNGAENTSCIVFCGGERYINGYDVEIIDTKDSIVLGRALRQEMIQFGFNIAEYNNTQVKYSNEFSLPIVVYKAKKIYYRGGELVRHVINQNGDKLKVRLKWLYND